MSEHGQESGQDTENDYGVVFADFSITETQTTALNKIAAPCKFYNDDREKNPAAPGETEFTKCFKEKFRGVLASQVSISPTSFVAAFCGNLASFITSALITLSGFLCTVNKLKDP